MGTEKKLRVAICGAGIGGLTAAVALSKYPNIEVTIFEAAAELGEVGAGIGFFSRPWGILQKLGLEQDLLKLSEVKQREGPVTAFKYRKSDQKEGLEFYTLVTNGKAVEGALMVFHRADFQHVLLRRLPNSYKTRCSRRLRSYARRRPGPIELLFEDGSQATCDVLVGADGLKSAVRRSLVREKAQKAVSEGRWDQAAYLEACSDPVWTGTNAYRALIPADRLKEKAPFHRALTQPTQYLGKNGYIIAYPLSYSTKVNFVAFTSRHDLENTTFNGPWTTPTDTSEFSRHFSGWEADVQALLEGAEKPLRWAIHAVRPLPTFVSDRVALIGDAAHAMNPHQGSGAGQAVEVSTQDTSFHRLLKGHPKISAENVNVALDIYDRVRRPVAQEVAERSRLNGQYFSFHCGDVDFDTLQEPDLTRELQRLGHTFKENWEWAWSTTVDDCSQKAISMLELQISLPLPYL